MASDNISTLLAISLHVPEPPSLDLLKTLSDRMADVLRELTKRQERTKPIAVWVLRRVDVGSLSIEVEGQPADGEISPAVIGDLCQQLLDDISSITRDPVSWSERHAGEDGDFLEALRRLGALGVDCKASVGLRYRDNTAELEGALVEKVDALLKARFTDWGVVEGYLEMVTLHRQRYFRVYPAGATRGVECSFEEALLPRVRELLGRRVSIWGSVRRSTGGSIERMEVKEIEPLEPKKLEEIRPKEPLWPSEGHEELRRWTREE